MGGCPRSPPAALPPLYVPAHGSGGQSRDKAALLRPGNMVDSACTVCGNMQMIAEKGEDARSGLFPLPIPPGL